ncbi:BCL-6 corepressor-like protein 1 [Desmophyllum pertusum]|uniref:BCL-6 corepressor-like protein 1 n=1 Tax=Desmophyllum pertusum TaxID=174260 RepID=A0A9X0CS34_9CNID|nr:BCL-6 corepressor-like protein 1 [Desmophyllum pertusum]
MNGNKDKPTTVVNDTKKQSASNVWLKKLKRRRLWFSQRRSITVKPTAQEENLMVKSSEDQQTLVIKRKRSNSTHDSDEQPKRKRKHVETDKRAFVAKPKDSPQTIAVLPSQKNTDVKPAKVRRHSSERDQKENVPESTSCKRSVIPGDMGRKVVKRARVEIEPLRVNRQEVILDRDVDGAKGDKTHRVKTYMLVTAYQGFRDFKPIVLESRTRGKIKQTDNEEQPQTTKPSEFPLLVVESVNSKPVKNSVIAENEEVQQLVENCLKARGKWRVDETMEEDTNEDDILKEAKKLNVNRNTGETILHKAARLGYHETVHHHIYQGINPNAKDNAGWTPLHEACSRGKVDVVKVLAKYGADVNAFSNDGIRPIHDAAEGGHVDVLRVLLSYGADPLLATYSGHTALDCAKEPNTRAFLEGFLEDLDLTNSTLSGNETEGCWEFSGSCSLLDASSDQTSGIFEGVPKDEILVEGEFEMCDRPHLPTYNLPVMANDEFTSGRRNYVLLSDILEHLRLSRGALFKKARRLDIREMPWSQFMSEIADKSLCIVPRYSPQDSSTQEGMAELVPINYNLRRLLNIRVESVNMT